MIYLNQAATSFQKPECVLRAVTESFSGMGSAFRGSGEAEMSAARQIWHARCSLAELFGFATPERLVFTANATQALNTAIQGLLDPGDTVLATDWDHNSVLRPLYSLAEHGVHTEFWEADRQGQLSVEALERRLSDQALPRPRLVICTHASNLTGDMLDPGAVADAAHRHGALCLMDCAQSAGCFPIDLRKIKADLMCFTGHKGLMGPQGTGGLCVAPGVELRPLLSGGTGIRSYEKEQPKAYPEHLEAGTLNGPGICGLGAAAEYLLRVGVEQIHQRELLLLRRFLNEICDIPGVKLYGDVFAPERAATVALNLRELPSAELADVLMARYGIVTRAGAHCAPRLHRALGTEQQGAVRFSFGYFNTEQEVDSAAAALRELAEEFL